MKKLLHIATFIILSLPQHVSSNDFREAFQKRAIENSRTFHDKVEEFRSEIDENLSHDTKIVIFGADHDTPKTTYLFFKLADWLHGQDSSFNCIFFEIDKNYQEDIDHFLNGAKLKNSIRRVSMAMGKPVILNRKFLEWIRANNINLFAYDLENSLNKFIPLYEKFQSGDISDAAKFYDFVALYRNKVMAENIQGYIQNNSCKRSIVLVGAGHIDNDLIPQDIPRELFSQEIKTLSEHLSGLGLSNQQYLLEL